MITDDKELYSESNEEELEHYGMPKRSGRYPWGSGDNPYQNSGDFLSRVDELKKSGMKITDIAESMGLSTTQLRAQLSLAGKERRTELIAKIKSLEADGLNRVEIASRLNLKGESSVRSLLNSDSEARMKIADKTADNLRAAVDEKGMIDIGVGVERSLGISKEKMYQAIEILKLEGYEVYGANVPQATNKGKYTRLKVLCPPGTQHKEIYNFDKIHSLVDYISRDGGDTFEPSFVYPASLDSNRIQINYSEDGGKHKDGVVELRRGVKDISLGNSNYSQVRILVDGTHYIKGMAVYSDNLPDGVDVLFNTNKLKGTPKLEVLKKIKDDPDNPFGSSIKEHGGQSTYIDANGEKKLSVINKRSDEGDWGDWSRELSSQFLSKQPMKLINKQLNLAINDKNDEFEEINALTNPTVKKALLVSFADDCDAASVHLKAASLPGQTYKVILPLLSLKDNETYAPHLEDGTQVALVRYPHGGTFEIPILTVNNRNKEGRDILSPNPSDAIGINSKVAERLSGADFDGDTVMVIPSNDNVKIKSTQALKQLEGFDGKLNYGPDQPPKIINGKEHYFRGGKEYSIMKESTTQLQMGTISNLITDMTLKGASEEELSRAVKHSMVVIDANKHHLDYKQSEVDNGIRLLHKKYQSQTDEYGREHLGASTLISKSKSEKDVPERKDGGFFARDTGNRLTLIDSDNKIYFDEKTNKVYSEKEKRTLYTDPVTGEKLYHDTNRVFTRAHFKGKDGKTKKAGVYVDVDGKYKPIDKVTLIVKDHKLYYKDEDGQFTQVSNEKITKEQAMIKSTRMAETSDARTLSSGTPQEEAYATYANKLKKLANEARREILIIDDIPYSPSAKETYKDEVTALQYKLNVAQLNAPKERQAQTISASIIKAKKQEDPTMTSEHLKKLSQQELARARRKVGAIRSDVKITPKEWEAIQSGAISHTRLEQIIANADLDILRQLAMPRTSTILSDSKIRRLKSMASAGYTSVEIAKSLGIPVSTVSTYLKGDE